MSEVKFACPVCGQHITADSAATGKKLQCPTCYRKIIIPQVGFSAESKLIVSAVEADKPRPTQTLQTERRLPLRTQSSIFATIAFILVASGVAGSLYFFRDHIFGKSRRDANAKNLQSNDAAPSIYPVPTNFGWNLNLKNASFPQGEVAGRIRGAGFLNQKVTLQAGNITFRQGQTWPPDLGVSIAFFAKQGEELSGKFIEVTSDRPPPVPQITVRWKDSAGRHLTETIPSGYALKVQFGEAAAGHIKGNIYLSLPDAQKSFLGGNFDAEIRKPPPPRPKQPMPTKPRA